MDRYADFFFSDDDVRRFSKGRLFLGDALLQDGPSKLTLASPLYFAEGNTTPRPAYILPTASQHRHIREQEERSELHREKVEGIPCVKSLPYVYDATSENNDATIQDDEIGGAETQFEYAKADLDESQFERHAVRATLEAEIKCLEKEHREQRQSLTYDATDDGKNDSYEEEHIGGAETQFACAKAYMEESQFEMLAVKASLEGEIKGLQKERTKIEQALLEQRQTLTMGSTQHSREEEKGTETQILEAHAEAEESQWVRSATKAALEAEILTLQKQRTTHELELSSQGPKGKDGAVESSSDSGRMKDAGDDSEGESIATEMLISTLTVKDFNGGDPFDGDDDEESNASETKINKLVSSTAEEEVCGSERDVDNDENDPSSPALLSPGTPTKEPAKVSVVPTTKEAAHTNEPVPTKEPAPVTDLFGKRVNQKEAIGTATDTQTTLGHSSGNRVQNNKTEKTEVDEEGLSDAISLTQDQCAQPTSKGRKVTISPQAKGGWVDCSKKKSTGQKTTCRSINRGETVHDGDLSDEMRNPKGRANAGNNKKGKEMPTKSSECYGLYSDHSEEEESSDESSDEGGNGNNKKRKFSETKQVSFAMEIGKSKSRGSLNENRSGRAKVSAATYSSGDDSEEDGSHSSEGESDELISADESEECDDTKKLKSSAMPAKASDKSNNALITSSEAVGSGWLSRRTESDVVLSRIKRKEHGKLLKKRRRSTARTTDDAVQPQRPTTQRMRFAPAPVAANKRKRQTTLKSIFKKR